MNLSNASIIYFIYVSFCVWRQLCHSINASYINKYDVIIVGCGVSGLKAAVPDADIADFAIVSAKNDSGVGLYLINLN